MLSAWQVMATAREGEPYFEFFICYLLSHEYLEPLMEVIGPSF